MDTAPTTNVAIIGLGVMGASLGAALRLAGGWHVSGFDVAAEAAGRAQRDGSIDVAAGSLGEAVGSAELIVLATPVATILEDLGRLPSCAPDAAVVMDLGSTKRAICAAMDALPERFGAIGGHPMAGRQTAGVDGVSASLYRGRPFVLVDTERSDARVRALAGQLIRDIGAHPVQMDAADHDRVVAMISHAPHFLSVALLSATDEMGDPSVWPLAAGGFRAVTAPASDNLRMWLDIAASNGDSIAAALRAVAAQLEGLADVLSDHDADEMQRVLDGAAALFVQRLARDMPATNARPQEDDDEQPGGTHAG